MALDDSILNCILTGGNPLTLEECIQKVIEYDHRVLARRRHINSPVAPFRHPNSVRPTPRPMISTQTNVS
jgi:hypothetical protein